MTILLIVANKEVSTLLADRRISAGGRPLSDETNKIISCSFRDAQIALGFTGLAKVAGFSLEQWLAAEIGVAAIESGYLVGRTLQSWGVRLAAKISSLSLAPMDSRLSLLFAGYVYPDGKPVGTFGLISNFQTIQGDLVGPTNRFSNEFFLREESENWGGAYIAGDTSRVNFDHIVRLSHMALEYRPIPRLREFGYKIIQDAGVNKKSIGNVGRQCGSITIPSDRNFSISTGYETGDNTSTLFLPTLIDATGNNPGGAVLTIRGANVTATNNLGLPFAVLKVGRNQLCPCGGGAKFKFCHGASPARGADHQENVLRITPSGFFNKEPEISASGDFGQPV